jgi:hypothetical protein
MDFGNWETQETVAISKIYGDIQQRRKEDLCQKN